MKTAISIPDAIFEDGERLASIPPTLEQKLDRSV